MILYSRRLPIHARSLQLLERAHSIFALAINTQAFVMRAAIL